MATEAELKKYYNEYDEAKKHFLYYYKPEFDRAYKQFAQYTGDRAKHLEKTADGEIWQSNVYWGQIFAYIKIFLQKIVGVNPDFNLKGKNSEPLKEVILKLWEIGMSDDLIDHFLQVLICGTSIGKDFLKKEVRKKRKKEIGILDKIKKLIFKTEIVDTVFRPDFEPVDIYSFYPHRRMKKLKDNLPVFQRYVLTLDEAKDQYPNVPESFWSQFEDKENNTIKSNGDTADYAWVRKEVLLEIRKNLRETTESSSPIDGGETGMPSDMPESKEQLFEIVERWIDGRLTVFMPQNGNPKEIKDIDNVYDHNEKPYQRIIFFPRPFQFYGFGMVKLVEHLQELMNTVANQRVDAVTMRIHGMLAAAPVALPGYKNSIKMGPMKILWTNDPNSIKEFRFGDVNPSAYMEMDKIREMMRIIVGIDDYTALKGADRRETATVASFMKEATLEGVKLFLIMLRNSYSGHFDHWISMIKQFWTKRSVVPKKILALLDDYSDVDFPVGEENWIDENGDHLLFPDEYNHSIEAASTLATSTELKKAKDLELWDLVKDAEDMVDEETGQIYSVKKFKILMKIIEDYGWEAQNYVVPKKIPTEVVDNQGRSERLPPNPSATEVPPPEREDGVNFG